MTKKTGQIRKASCNDRLEESAEAFPWGHPAGASFVPVRVGHLRGDLPALSACSDCEAVFAWLKEASARSAKTYDAYRREAERLLLWAAQIDKSLSEVVREDILVYYEFLATAPKNSPLVTKRVWRRTDSRWRPFTKPLSDNAQRNAQLILSSLYQYLTASGWLRANPQPPSRIKPSYVYKPLARCLDNIQTDAVVAFLYQQERYASEGWERMNAVRDRWIIAVGIHLALPAGLSSRARMSDFRSALRGEQTVWNLHVRSRGRASTTIPVTETCLEELMRFRQAIGLCPLPSQHEEFPMIPDFRQVWRTKASSVEGIACTPVTTQTIYRRVKAVFAGAAYLLMEMAYYDDADRLKSANPYCLRHTSIRDFVACVSNLTIAQKFARHSSCALTARYAADTNHDIHGELVRRRPYR